MGFETAPVVGLGSESPEVSFADTLALEGHDESLDQHLILQQQQQQQQQQSQHHLESFVSTASTVAAPSVESKNRQQQQLRRGSVSSAISVVSAVPSVSSLPHSATFYPFGPDRGWTPQPISVGLIELVRNCGLDPSVRKTAAAAAVTATATTSQSPEDGIASSSTIPLPMNVSTLLYGREDAPLLPKSKLLTARDELTWFMNTRFAKRPVGTATQPQPQSQQQQQQQQAQKQAQQQQVQQQVQQQQRNGASSGSPTIASVLSKSLGSTYTTFGAVRPPHPLSVSTSSQASKMATSASATTVNGMDNGQDGARISRIAGMIMSNGATPHSVNSITSNRAADENPVLAPALLGHSRQAFAQLHALLRVFAVDEHADSTSLILNTIVQIPPAILAYAITLLDLALFQRVTARSLILYSSNSSLSSTSSTSDDDAFVAIRDQFNHLTRIVERSILTALHPVLRAARIQYWIRIARALHDLNNFQSLQAIICSLASTPIARLKRTWAEVRAKDVKRLERLQAMLSSEMNHKQYRMSLERVLQTVVHQHRNTTAPTSNNQQPALTRQPSSPSSSNGASSTLKNGCCNFRLPRQQSSPALTATPHLASNNLMTLTNPDKERLQVINMFDWYLFPIRLPAEMDLYAQGASAASAIQHAPAVVSAANANQSLSAQATSTPGVTASRMPIVGVIPYLNVFITDAIHFSEARRNAARKNSAGDGYDPNQFIQQLPFGADDRLIGGAQHTSCPPYSSDDFWSQACSRCRRVKQRELVPFDRFLQTLDRLRCVPVYPAVPPREFMERHGVVTHRYMPAYDIASLSSSASSISSGSANSATSPTASTANLPLNASTTSLYGGFPPGCSASDIRALVAGERIFHYIHQRPYRTTESTLSSIFDMGGPPTRNTSKALAQSRRLTTQASHLSMASTTSLASTVSKIAPISSAPPAPPTASSKMPSLSGLFRTFSNSNNSSSTPSSNTSSVNPTSPRIRPAIPSMPSMASIASSTNSLQQQLLAQSTRAPYTSSSAAIQNDQLTMPAEWSRDHITIALAIAEHAFLTAGWCPQHLVDDVSRDLEPNLLLASVDEDGSSLYTQSWYNESRLSLGMSIGGRVDSADSNGGGVDEHDEHDEQMEQHQLADISEMFIRQLEYHQLQQSHQVPHAHSILGTSFSSSSNSNMSFGGDSSLVAMSFDQSGSDVDAAKQYSYMPSPTPFHSFQDDMSALINNVAQTSMSATAAVAITSLSHPTNSTGGGISIPPNNQQWPSTRSRSNTLGPHAM